MNAAVTYRESLKLAVPMVSDVVYLARQMRSDEIAQYLAVSGFSQYDPDDAVRNFLSIPGESYVLVDDKHMPILLGGFSPVRRGVYEGWQVGTDAGWAKHWRAITKVSRRLIDGMLDREGVHRIQVCAVASRAENTFKWYQHGLGLSVDGTLPGYCANGEDAIMFSKVRR